MSGGRGTPGAGPSVRTTARPSGLRALLRSAPPEGARPGTRCEMCGEPIAAEHRHVADLERRGVLCACPSCHLLFTREGAGQGRYRAVPDRYLYDPAFPISEAQWEALEIPVGVAFFFRNQALDRVVAFYPSPAGATESSLDLHAWERVVAAGPRFADLAPDVEALLVRRQAGGFACYLVPIDACYRLVGLVRLHWKGFDGGEQAHRAIDAFFADLRARSRSVRPGG